MEIKPLENNKDKLKIYYQNNKEKIKQYQKEYKELNKEKLKQYKQDKKEKTAPVPLQSNSNEYGYCYIGKTNNVRNCAKVSSKNKCMSGDIFPTMDLCINPNLRN